MLPVRAVIPCPHGWAGYDGPEKEKLDKTQDHSQTMFPTGVSRVQKSFRGEDRSKSNQGNLSPSMLLAFFFFSSFF